MSYAAISDHRVTKARIHMPMHGVWSGTFELEEEAELSGKHILTIGDLELVGTVRRGGSHAGAAHYWIDGGAAGWEKTLAARGYRSDGGVRLQLLVEDLARECGETLAAGYADREVGKAFARELAPASRSLALLVGATGWYVGTDGVTVLAARQVAPVTVEHTLTQWHPATRLAVVATEEPAAFAPGKTVPIEGVDWTIAAVQLELESSALRLHLQLDTAAVEEPMLRALRSLVREMLPRLAYAGGPFEYRVISKSGDQYDIDPVDKSIGHAQLARVELRPGIPGAKATLDTGSRVLVSFINNDPARPFICAFEEPSGSGFVSTLLSIDGDRIDLGAGFKRVIREGDQVTLGNQAGAIAFVNPLDPLLSKVFA